MHKVNIYGKYKKKGVVLMSFSLRKNEKRLLCSAFAVFAAGMLALALFLPQGDSIPAAAAEDAATALPAVPILMYHSVCNNTRVQGDYRISPEMFEKDLAYLHDRGYHTIHVADLAAYVYEGVPLPENPIILTLDDGYLNNLTTVLPLLEKYDMRATVSVVGEFTAAFSETADPNPFYAYLTWEDIRTLSESGRIEIGNHTYSMHELGDRRGCMMVRGESETDYQATLKKDLQKLQDALAEYSGVTPTVFTYPYGFISDASYPVLREMGFLAALSCYERINYITGEPEQLYRLGRFNRPPHLTTKAFMQKAGL